MTRNRSSKFAGSGPGNGAAALVPGGLTLAEDEVLSQSERSRISRRFVRDGSVIVKQSLGAEGERRARHERTMLARLSSVAGVAKLSTATYGDAGADAIVLEDDHGVPLARVLLREKLGIAALLELGRQLAETIAAVHGLGVVHRDINPSNILLVGPGCRPVLIDFHIASFADGPPALADPGQIVGTLAYIAPEQTGRTGRVTDERADLYALGVTLYELAIGRTPFESADAFDVIGDHLAQVPIDPATLDPNVPRVLSDIIMRLLQKEPDRRYQSAAGLASDLRFLVERRPAGTNETFALGEHDFPQRLLAPSRLVGREKEMVTVRAAFDDAIAGRGSALLVSGAPGVGKTALIDEARAIVAARAGWFVTGKYDQYRQDVESDAGARAFHNLLGLLLAEPEEELAPLRIRLLRELSPNAELAVSALPELGLLLGISPTPAPDYPVNAQARLAHAGVAILKSIASAARPIVFAIDDLQWASQTALGFFDALICDSSIVGVLFVGAYRTEDVDASHPLAALLRRWARLATPPSRVFLNDLTPIELGRMLEEMLRVSPSQATALAATVGVHTSGNPYDTVVFVNALRQGGALVPSADGWTWDEATIRRFIGQGDVVDLLTARIAALPAESAALVDTFACLGGDVAWDVLRTAGGLSDAELEARLVPALENGLALVDDGHTRMVRFRHDRVQQAAYGRIERASRLVLHRTLARRLAPFHRYAGVAAEQYLPAFEALDDPEERSRVVELFRSAALQAGVLANHAVVESFTAAALKMLDSSATRSTRKTDVLVASLERELHAALYSLGRLEEADTVYRSIERRSGSGLESIDSACVQMSSMTNRNQLREALELGFDSLRTIGIVPPEREGLAAIVAGRVEEIYRWCDDESSRASDQSREQASDPRVVAAGKLITRLLPPAFFVDQAVVGWLVLESLRLWSEHGPQAALIGPIAHLNFVASAIRNDYRIGYQAARHMLAVGEARGYEPETSHVRFLFALAIQPWFEPREDCIAQAHKAREGLVRGGDLQNASFAYYATVPLLFECAPTVAEFAVEVEAALAFTVRTGNGLMEQAYLPYLQLAKALRGETVADGSFADETFDEQAFVARHAGSPMPTVSFHIARATSALLFGDEAELERNANAAMAFLPAITATFPTAVAQRLRAWSLGDRVRRATPLDRPALLLEFDSCRDWIARRAVDAPDNFLYAIRLIEAERAWALGDFEAASRGFEVASREGERCRSPRHGAFIAERAGHFYREQGMERYGLLLLDDARKLYAAWGATAKVRQLERLLDAAGAPSTDTSFPTSQRPNTTINLSSETIDMVGIVRASVALSSQTTVPALKAKVIELLAELTGATDVLLVLRDEMGEWVFAHTEDDGEERISVREAGARGLLPLTAFRYVERTREPLILEDALRDDRFARDPHFVGCERCSLLLVPILSQGNLLGVALLENRLGRGAFSPGRLDAVLLIAGQLAVSLDNAQLYASLEEKVAERTEALEVANGQLALLSRTDALTGLTNRRGFDERLAEEWSRSKRMRASIGLAMIDIDEFKKYNDHFGHMAGDACLSRVGATLRASLRFGNDRAARYGGEEFALILPDTDIHGTAIGAERVRAAVEALDERHPPASHGIVTVSIGIFACVPSEDGDVAQCLQAADIALYEAKRRGRNQVVRFEVTARG